MRLVIVIAGLTKFAPSIDVEPHDTIETLFEQLKTRLLFHRVPPTFLAAYSLQHGRATGLPCEDPDYAALKRSDPIVMAQYFTPAAQLDPSKTVADYFGHRVTPRTVSIALTWPPESLAFVYRLRELADQYHYHRRQARARANAAAAQAASATPDCGTVSEPALELSSLLLEMAVGCLPWSTLSRWWWTTTLTDAKKHD